ncbi:hypothetical protein AGMMS50276_29320 [Synergistales bacterium]|nr:hypothetical protein AGMMS50276_29320 [Synergistales bacterium]
MSNISCKSIVKSLIPPFILIITRGAFRFVKKLLIGKYQTYSIGRFNVKLNRDHALPRIQERYKMYDRFLPFLASYLCDGVIFDIGANVGDTLLAMLDKMNPESTSTFVCIEPDRDYFALMKKNIEVLDSFHYAQRIFIENAFCATSKESKTTVKSAGTAKTVLMPVVQKVSSGGGGSICYIA